MNIKNKNKEVLIDTLEEFFESFRIYYERYALEVTKAHIDKKEYIHNCRAAVNNILESFHKFYDKYKIFVDKELFKSTELMTIIELRNCMHHYKLRFIDELVNPKELKRYYLIDFYNYEGRKIKLNVKWEDFRRYLINKSRINIKEQEAILEYLGYREFEDVASKLGKQIDELYINILPLIMNAGKLLLDAIKKIIGEKKYKETWIIERFENHKIDTKEFLFILATNKDGIIVEEFYFMKNKLNEVRFLPYVFLYKDEEDDDEKYVKKKLIEYIPHYFSVI